MLARTDLRGARATTAQLRRAMPRGATDVDAVLGQVKPVIDAIRDRGAEAALEYGKKFDGVAPDTVRVPTELIDQALAAIDPDVRAALTESIDRARKVHADQRRTDVTTEVSPGGTVTERWIPVSRVLSLIHI